MRTATLSYLLGQLWSENESSWRFFLSNLYVTIPEVDHPATTMSDRDKGLHAAYNEVIHAACATCVEHLSHNVQQKNFGVPSCTVFNLSIRFALAETHLQVSHLCIHFALYSLCFC